MKIDYFYLAAAVGTYAVGLVCQSVGAKRQPQLGVRFQALARLAGDPLYIVGFLCQTAGFVLAFLARANLPIYLVQGAVCASVALAAFIGYAVLGRQTSTSELAVFVAMAGAVAMLLAASRPSNAYDISGGALLGFAILTVVVTGATFAASRCAGAVPLACLAGVSFAVLAVAGRPVASHIGVGLVGDPLAWIVLATAVVGQVQMALALARGSTTVVGSVMDSTTLVVGSVVGLLLLGDRIAEGRALWVIVGVLISVGGVAAMAGIDSRRRRAAESSKIGRTDAVEIYMAEG
ncbi:MULTISPECIES: hypothetical protein [Gordonia]|uniref:EamA domain-containing protein n=1 Tax=Gordonia sputi NBRC 100414 TaxID=1089453 RepID=H5U6C5_9ACTN|nr:MULTISPECIES: hypothetical protein [Gordonia]NKY92189.1 hypothetical protein [Gordonia sputi]GAB41283.1 hypothetical protein GOSPT_125_00500 [Gordonia sputi NBRC 100414]